MNIYAEPGTRVVYTGENGYPIQHKRLQSIGVKVGAILVVEHVEIYSSMSYVSFKEVEGSHNSVMFEEV